MPNSNPISSMIVFPSQTGRYKWLVNTPTGTRRGDADTQSAAWTLARLAKEALGD